MSLYESRVNLSLQLAEFDHLDIANDTIEITVVGHYQVSSIRNDQFEICHIVLPNIKTSKPAIKD